MDILKKFFIFTENLLIVIGSLTIAFFSLCLSFLQLLVFLFVTIVGKIKQVILYPFKKHKNKLGYTSYKTKLKYFFIGTIFSFIFVFLPIVVIILLQNLPNPNSLQQEQFPQTTKIYDRNHHLLYQFMLIKTEQLSI